MSREFTYQLAPGQDKTYNVRTIIDGEEKTFKCVVANDESELAELLEFTIDFYNSLEGGEQLASQAEAPTP